ncbi:hypothetical protein GDO86_018365, partial [Hymenochirus boettgeri]
VPFLVLLLILLALGLWITFAPLGFMVSLLQLQTSTDITFRCVLFGMDTVQLIIAIAVELALDHGILNCLRRLRKEKESKKLYKRLEKSLSVQLSWPPVDQTLHPTPIMTGR